MIPTDCYSGFALCNSWVKSTLFLDEFLGLKWGYVVLWYIYCNVLLYLEYQIQACLLNYRIYIIFMSSALCLSLALFGQRSSVITCRVQVNIHDLWPKQKRFLFKPFRGINTYSSIKWDITVCKIFKFMVFALYWDTWHWQNLSSVNNFLHGKEIYAYTPFGGGKCKKLKWLDVCSLPQPNHPWTDRNQRHKDCLPTSTWEENP